MVQHICIFIITAAFSLKVKPTLKVKKTMNLKNNVDLMKIEMIQMQV